MPADQTTLAAIFKNVYCPTVIDALNSGVKALRSFQAKPSELWEGAAVIWAMRVGRNQGFGYGAPAGPVAEAGVDDYINISVPLRYSHGRFGIDGPTMKTARTRRGAFINTLDRTMDSLKEGMAKDENRIIFGDGRGTLALVNVAGTGAASITIDSPGGTPGAVNGARFVQINTKIAFIHPTTGALLAVRQVTSLAADGLSVGLNAAVSAAEAPDNAFIVRAPSLATTVVGHTAYQNEPMGLMGMVDDGNRVNNYFGVNRTTYPAAQASVINLASTPLSADILQQAIDAAAQKGEGQISEIWCHHSVRRAYLAVAFPMRYYTTSGAPVMPDVGSPGQALKRDPEFGEVPIKVDQDAPFGTMIGNDTRYLLNFENTPFEWVDDDTGRVLLRTPGMDAFEGIGRRFGNYACEKPSACMRIDTIPANVAVIHVA